MVRGGGEAEGGLCFDTAGFLAKSGEENSTPVVGRFRFITFFVSHTKLLNVQITPTPPLKQ